MVDTQIKIFGNDTEQEIQAKLFAITLAAVGINTNYNSWGNNKTLTLKKLIHKSFSSHIKTAADQKKVLAKLTYYGFSLVEYDDESGDAENNILKTFFNEYENEIIDMADGIVPSDNPVIGAVPFTPKMQKILNVLSWLFAKGYITWQLINTTYDTYSTAEELYNLVNNALIDNEVLGGGTLSNETFDDIFNAVKDDYLNLYILKDETIPANLFVLFRSDREVSVDLATYYSAFFGAFLGVGLDVLYKDDGTRFVGDYVDNDKNTRALFVYKSGPINFSYNNSVYIFTEDYADTAAIEIRYITAENDTGQFILGTKAGGSINFGLSTHEYTQTHIVFSQSQTEHDITNASMSEDALRDILKKNDGIRLADANTTDDNAGELSVWANVGTSTTINIWQPLQSGETFLYRVYRVLGLLQYTAPSQDGVNQVSEDYDPDTDGTGKPSDTPPIASDDVTVTDPDTGTTTTRKPESVEEAIDNDIIRPVDETANYSNVNPSQSEIVNYNNANVNTLYKMSLSQVNGFSTVLCQSLFDIATEKFTSLGNSLRSLFNNPIDSCGLRGYPLSITADNSEAIKVCGYELSPSVVGNKITKRLQEYNLGSIVVPEKYNNFLDYTATECSIYLPFLGFQTLDTQEVLGSTLTLKYLVNIGDGTFIATLSRKNGPFSGVVEQWSGQCGETIPLIQRDNVSIMAATIGAAAVGNRTAGPLGALATTAGMLAINPGQMRGQGTFSGNASMLCNLRPYILLKRPIIDKPTSFDALKGKKDNRTVVVGNMSGFVKFQDIKINDYNTIPGATERELYEIEQALKNGIFMS